MNYLICCFVLILFASCSPAHRISRDLRTKPVYTDHFTGVALYDPDHRRMLIQHNADKPFTPASNTKLFSFYVGLLNLPDSLPSLCYVVRGDSLIFWGTGNPLLLHPDLPDNSALAFLKSRPEQLFFSPANYDGPRLGPGWAWDDYGDDYSAELASLPIYGNVVRFRTGQQSVITVSPRRFIDSTRTAGSSTSVRRAESANQFTRPVAGRAGRQDVPFRWSPTLAAQLLTDTLRRPVTVINRPVLAEARLLRGLATDSLYKRMLYVSDNQFAEQVLFMASAERKVGQLNPAGVIKHAVDSVLKFPLTPDGAVPARWADGSGLSRYNLFTPNTLINLLGRIYAIVPRRRLFTLLPAAGQSGALRQGAVSEGPYVFAKSGSMTGVYNLSGYVLTRRGKTLFFSIMHNNFTQPVGEMRKRTAALLAEIHDRF